VFLDGPIRLAPVPTGRRRAHAAVRLRIKWPSAYIKRDGNVRHSTQGCQSYRRGLGGVRRRLARPISPDQDRRAADLRECLRVERPTIAGRIKGRIGDLVELAAEAVADD
jgi:hypothetical protein